MNAFEASKIKVGDRVTLYTYDELNKLGFVNDDIYEGEDRAYNINTPINVIPHMMPCLGKTLKVIKIGPYADYPISDDWHDGTGFYVKLADGLHADEYPDEPDSDYYYDMHLIKEIAEQNETPEFPSLQVKPGETVILWSKEDMIKQYGVDKFGVINIPVDIVGEMAENLGTEVIVDEIKSYQAYSSEITEKGYCFTIKDDPMGYWYDMKCVKGIKTVPEKNDIPEEKKEESKMKNFLKEFIKVMAEKYNDWNTPTTGEKVDSILELVHSGYVTADYAAEIIERILSEENC